jgi:hypothetical protein
MTAFPTLSRQISLWGVALVLAVFAHGQAPQAQVLNYADVNSCQSTFAFGSGPTLFNFCVSSHGNLVQFTSPEGFEHIREGFIGEGYGICDGNPKKRYFDYADGGVSGDWNDPVITQPGGPNTFPLKITRATSDGIFTLTQVFSRNTSERVAKIAMTIRNNSASPKTITLIRFADIDANNANHGNFMNEFDSGSDSAWGYNSRAYGVMISAVPVSVPHAGIVWNWNSGPDPCDPLLNITATPFLGDGSAGVIAEFGLGPGKSQTVSIEYQRF